MSQETTGGTESKMLQRVWAGYAGGSVSIFRAKLPGGWLILVYYQRGVGNSSVTFYPDANHTWDGLLLPPDVAVSE